MDFNYLKAHYEHLGHPPLYGDFPPLTILMYGWLGSACAELLICAIGRYNNKASSWDTIEMYVHVIDRFVCIFYWQNLTCLARFLTGTISNILAIIVCPGNNTGELYINSSYYVFNIIHMLIYIWRGKTNSISTTEAVTTSWFVIPNGYQQFAIFQLCMLVLEWILSFITYHRVQQQQESNKKQSKPITIIVPEGGVGEKQD